MSNMVAPKSNYSALIRLLAMLLVMKIIKFTILLIYLSISRTYIYEGNITYHNLLPIQHLIHLLYSYVGANFDAKIIHSHHTWVH